MSVLDHLKATFFDKDGAFSIPEISATIAGLAGTVSALWDFWGRAAHFNLQEFGVGVGALVVALGAAQRMRDGLWKRDEP